MCDPSSWTLRVQAALDQVLVGFEDRFGYPPDHNADIRASKSSADPLAALGGNAPAAVLDFFSVVDEVCLPDVWNGYFLGPAERIVRARSDPSSPRVVTWNGEPQEVLVVGSDGGGALYCVVKAEVGPVLRLQEVAVSEGVAVTPPGEIHQLAADFPDFLEELALAIQMFAMGQTPRF